MSTASTKLAELAFHERTEEAEAVAAFLMLRKKAGNNWRGVFSSSSSYFSSVSAPPKKVEFSGTLQIQLPLKFFHKMVEFSSNNRKKISETRIDFNIISKNHNDTNPIIFEMVISCPSKMELEKTKNRIIAEVNCLNLINRPSSPSPKKTTADVVWDDFISEKAKMANFQKCSKSYRFNECWEW